MSSRLPVGDVGVWRVRSRISALFGLLSFLAVRGSRVDCDRDADQVGDSFVHRPARLFDECPVPQCSRYIVEVLGIEFLATEPRALVLAYDLLQKRRREVGPIIVCR